MTRSSNQPSVPGTQAPRCDQRIVWMGLGLKVPWDWGIARHSIAMHKGGLSLVDRNTQRLQLTWTQCRRPPLIDRMFDDHQKRQLEQDAQAHFVRFHHGSGFDVLQRRLEHGRSLHRAARYDQPTRRLIEAVLLCEDQAPAERALRDAVLDSIEVHCPAEQARHWRGFGMEITVPLDYRPVRCQVQAADATFAFRHYESKPGLDPIHAKPRAEKITLRKIGMADVWDHHHPQKILLAQHKHQTFDFGQTTLNHDRTGEGPVDALTATSIEPGPRIKRWVGKLRNRRDLLWHSPRANALFHITTLSYDHAPLDPRQIHLTPVMDGIVE